jgi:hypothetical protein
MTERADMLSRMVKAGAYLLLVLVASVALAPDSFAHGLEDGRTSTVSVNARESVSQAAMDADAASADVRTVAADRQDRGGCATSCPSGDCGAGCPSCCGGATGCASCCGAATLPGNRVQPFLPMAMSRSVTTSVFIGIGTIPADPPPRVPLIDRLWTHRRR